MTQNGQNGKKANPGGKTAARRQRQADALRANLRRRKAGRRPAEENSRPAPTKPERSGS